MKFSEDQQRLMESLPPELARKLVGMILRVRRIMMTRGIMATMAAALLSVLAIMGIDAVLPLDSPVSRWFFSLVGLTTILATAWRVWLLPLSVKMTPMRMARILETRHPELQEKISAAVELLSSDDDQVFRGSKQLIELLGQEANLDVEKVAPEREFTERTIKPWRLAALIGFAVMLILLMVWPHQSKLLLARAVAPYAEFENMRAIGLHVSPGDITVLRGSNLQITLNAPGYAGQRAWLRRERAGGHETVERMREISSEGEEPVFEMVFPYVTEPFRYRVRAGVGLTRFYKVDVLPPPTVENVFLTYHYPEYTQRASHAVTNFYEIAGVYGTRVEVAATFNRPVNPALRLGDKLLVAIDTGPKTRWVFTLTETLPEQWSFQMEDNHGFTNTLAWMPLRAFPDRAPDVILEEPASSRITSSPRNRLPLKFSVSDDFGVSAVELWLAREPESFELYRTLSPVTRRENELWSGDDNLDLSRLALGNTRTIWIKLRALDNFPEEKGGPQEGISRIVEIEIDEEALSALRQTIQEQSDLIKENIAQAAERLETAANQLDEQASVMNNEQDVFSPEIMRKLDDVLHNAAIAEDILQTLQEAVMETPFQGLTADLAETLKEHITPAREAVETLSLSPSENSVEQAETAAQQLHNASEQTRNLLNEVDNMLARAEAAAMLGEMADRQSALADNIQQAEADSPPPLDWRNEQQQLANDLNARSQEGMMDASQLMTDALAAIEQALRSVMENQAEEQPVTDALSAIESAQKDARSAQEALAEQQPESLDEALASMQAAQEVLGEQQPEALASMQAAREAVQAAQEVLGEQHSEALASMQAALDAAQVEQAAKAAQRAAEQLQAAAQAAAREAGLPLPPGPSDQMASGDDGQQMASGDDGQPGDGDRQWMEVPLELKLWRTQLPDDVWIRYQTQLKDRTIEDALQEVAPEYRELVRRYFRELSRRDGRRLDNE